MNVLGRTDRWRNVPGAAVLMVILLLAAGFGVLYETERLYQEQKRNEVAGQARILAASVIAALDFSDRGAAQDAAQALSANPELRAAGVYDADGNLFAGYQRGAATLPEAPHLDGSSDVDVIEVTAPVMSSGEEIGTVLLMSTVEPVSRRFARYGFIALLVALGSLVVIVLAIAHGALSRANRQLEDRATALSHSNQALQIEMEERANAEEQLRQAQKMQALGQLTGGIAHDFNNLLTVIQGSADILRRPNLAEDKRIRFADAIVETAGRAAALTGQLLAFARRQPLRPQVIDIKEQMAAMTDLLGRALGANIEIRSELAEGLCAVEADPTQLETAILNIGVNARDAMPDGGTLTIRTRGPSGDDRFVAITMTDTGHGIEAETQARIFEPFFTTKSVGKGTGLGLSQVYGFAAQSGGDVRIESKVGEGTSITLLLPCTDKPLAAKPSARPGRAARAKTGNVLLVEDNEEVGAFAETLLDELGHGVLRARTAEEAIAIADAGAAFDVVFTDIVMPGISGIELAAELRSRRPNVPIILTTGYSDQLATPNGDELPIVLKPYRMEALAKALDEALSRRNG